MGNLLAIHVHAANKHDTKSGSETFLKALNRYPTLLGVCADAGYRGTFFIFITLFLGLVCDISERIKPTGWQILPKRWRVERTFGWMTHSRRLAKDYEIKTSSAECLIMISHSHTLLKRL